MTDKTFWNIITKEIGGVGKMKNARYILTLSLLMVLLFGVCGVRAETIVVEFDTDPTITPQDANYMWIDSTIGEANALAIYEYIPGTPSGYLSGKIRRNHLFPDRYYTDLLSDDYNEVGEYWVEFDISHVLFAGSDNTYTRSMLGLMNSSSGNWVNVLCTRFAFEWDVFGEPTSYRGNRHDLMIIDSASKGVQLKSPQGGPGFAGLTYHTNSPDMPYDEPLRMKWHYRWNDANGPNYKAYFEMTMYAIDPTTGASTGIIYTSPLDSKDYAFDFWDTKSEDNFIDAASPGLSGLDIFGIGARQEGGNDMGRTTESSGITEYNHVYIDNLYFSTVGTPETTGVWPGGLRKPDFPPFKVTVNQTKAATSTTTATLSSNLTLSNTSQAKYVYLKWEFYRDNVLEFTVPSSGTYPSDEKIAVGEANEVGPKTEYSLTPAVWSPSTPENVYQVKTLVYADSGAAVQVGEHDQTWAGFRQFYILGDNLRLNSYYIFLRGLSSVRPGTGIDSIWKDDGYMDAYIDKLKAMKVNIIPLLKDDLDDDDITDDWYSDCDQKGMMVIGGLSTGWEDFSDANEPNEAARLAAISDLIDNYGHHTSVVMWAIGKDWNLSDGSIASAAASLQADVCDLDYTRPVYLIGAEGAEGADFNDVINGAGGETGSVYDLQGFGTSQAVPVTLSECVFVVSNETDGALNVSDDELLGNALRNVGHSYNLGTDSMAFQAYVTQEAIEICRRTRLTTNSMSGVLPYSPPFLFARNDWMYGVSEANDAETDKSVVVAAITDAYSDVHASILLTKPNVDDGDTISSTIYILNDGANNAITGLSLLTELVDSDDVVQDSDGPDAIGNMLTYYTRTQAISLDTTSLAEGDYVIRATLTHPTDANYNDVSEVDVFISGGASLTNGATAVDVYDPGANTLAKLIALGASSTTAVGSIGASTAARLVIGGGVDIDGAAATAISTRLAAGARVLILEPSAVATGLLSTGMTLGSGSEDFVNIERPQLTTLMGDLDRTDFRAWNGSTTDRSLYSSYLDLDANDLADIAILANGGQHLSEAVLVEIYAGSGSCIINTVETIGRSEDDSKADKYLAGLVDYLLESATHEKNVEVGYTIEFANYASEKGAIAAPLLQGITVEDDGTADGKPESRAVAGEMELVGSEGEIVAVTPAATTASPVLYVRCIGDIAASFDIVVDAENVSDTSQGYTLKINGVSLGTAAIAAATRQSDSFTPSGTISAGADIKIEFDTADVGLLVHSIQLAECGDGDANCDGIVDFRDYAIVAADYTQVLADVWEF